jgi:hypothetical protein
MSNYNRSIDTKKLAEAMIYKRHGWSVAEQFAETWEDRSEDCILSKNSNALDCLIETLRRLVQSEALSEGAVEDIEEYLKALSDVHQ